jgi:hypothetical protein
MTGEHTTRLRPDAVDLVVLGVAALLVAGFVSVVTVVAWTPRFAALLLVVPAGLVVLVRAAVRGDRAAAVLMALVVWTFVAAAVQPDPLVRMFGMIGSESSVLVHLGVAACWALGRELGPAGRRALPVVVIAALGANLVVALAQLLLGVQNGPLSMSGGSRPQGLTSNPVYFGALMAAGCVLVAGLRPTGRHRAAALAAQVAGVALFAMGASISGTRSALPIVVVGVIALAWRRRTRASAGLVGAAVVGTALGALVQAVAPTSGGSSVSTAGRLGDAGAFVSGGLGWRVEGWTMGLASLAEKPFTGWGPGAFRFAVQTRIDETAAQATARFDAHNVFIELVVTLGVIGTLLAAVWVVLAGVRARGLLALVAVLMVSSWLLQPIGLATFPLAALLLGAATPPPVAAGDETGPGPYRSRLLGVAFALGAVVAGVVVVRDIALEQAIDAADPVALERIERWYPGDPIIADLTAQAHLFDAIEGVDGAEAATLRWSAEAVRRQPQHPRWRDANAGRLLYFGDPASARAELDEAIRLQPSRTTSWSLLVNLSRRIGDEETEARALIEVCARDEERCAALEATG